jgi:hypothetical protein
MPKLFLSAWNLFTGERGGRGFFFFYYKEKKRKEIIVSRLVGKY